MTAVAVFSLATLLPGCISVGDRNPRFDISDEEAYEDWKRMEANPVELDRPVVFIGSYRGPDFHVSSLNRRFVKLTSGDRDDFARIPTWFDDTTGAVVDRTIAVTADRFGLSEDGTETVEVDVIGLSMGGVIARAAAVEAEGRPRLKIRNLYTIASPHRGANLAGMISPDACARDLCCESDFINAINDVYEDHAYELYPYGVLNDGVVGVINTAPPGELPIWTRGKFWGSHMTVVENRPIITDIARRLRDEEPIAERGEPLPAYH